MLEKQRKLLIVSTLLLFSMMICGASPIDVSAAVQQDGIVSVYSMNTASSSVNMSISKSGNAKILARVIGKAGTQKIHLVVKLQKYDSKTGKWKNIRTWEKTRMSPNISVEYSHSLNAKGNYRCKTSASVYKNGKSETVTMLSEKEQY